MRFNFVTCKNCGARIWVKRPPKEVRRKSPPNKIRVKPGESAEFSFSVLRYSCDRCGRASRYLPQEVRRWWQILG